MAGAKYFLESSKDLKSWSAAGEPFIAESENLTQEFVIQQSGQFFRVTQLP
jgi:hypothetical protein